MRWDNDLANDACTNAEGQRDQERDIEGWGMMQELEGSCAGQIRKGVDIWDGAGCYEVFGNKYWSTVYLSGTVSQSSDIPVAQVKNILCKVIEISCYYKRFPCAREPLEHGVKLLIYSS